MNNEMPTARRRLLYMGVILLFSVYYMNYALTFKDGMVTGDSKWIITAAKGCGILAICIALWPINRTINGSDALCALYIVFGLSFVSAIWSSQPGKAYDALFLNTLGQVPILLMLTHTAWRLDFKRWLTFIGYLFTAQLVIDIVVWLSGRSLWADAQFVGGVGNPSSFGFMCAIFFAFFLYQPDGRWYRFLAACMAAGAVLSMSLSAISAVAIAWFLRASRKARILVTLVTVPALFIILRLSAYDTEDGKPVLIIHKLRAAFSAFGFGDERVSSDSFSARLAMHRETFEALALDPVALVSGHLNGLPYWPVDSQILAYIGSFGLILTLAFLALHIWWMTLAGRGSGLAFPFISLTLFAFAFLTTRILDYFPIATVYFICIALAHQHNRPSKVNESYGGIIHTDRRAHS